MAHFQPGQFPDAKTMLLGKRFELRPGTEGHFDELVSTKRTTAHFEMMDDGLLWVALGPEHKPGGKYRGRVTLWIRAKRGKLEITVSDEE